MFPLLFFIHDVFLSYNLLCYMFVLFNCNNNIVKTVKCLLAVVKVVMCNILIWRFYQVLLFFCFVIFTKVSKLDLCLSVNTLRILCVPAACWYEELVVALDRTVVERDCLLVRVHCPSLWTQRGSTCHNMAFEGALWIHPGHDTHCFVRGKFTLQTSCYTWQALGSRT